MALESSKNWFSSVSQLYLANTAQGCLGGIHSPRNTPPFSKDNIFWLGIPTNQPVMLLYIHAASLFIKSVSPPTEAQTGLHGSSGAHKRPEMPPTPLEREAWIKMTYTVSASFSGVLHTSMKEEWKNSSLLGIPLGLEAKIVHHMLALLSNLTFLPWCN